ncbi:mitochondrial basic amino acids transporter isoform X5 [Elephas maximus indicus]|uniref:mitochondrial basic amino acids transporter isoform X5 n=1 Tax=Elephas maximus indicus TaxID=99487 RepID=UPI002116DBC3|nr:mitochondrial basic amino acids transporter isoform X5 [Elephas maximus indicus]
MTAVLRRGSGQEPSRSSVEPVAVLGAPAVDRYLVEPSGAAAGTECGKAPVPRDGALFPVHHPPGECAAAGAIQCIICCPMELAKTRLQLQDAGPARTYKGSLDCLVQIYRHEGLRGVNRGMVSTLLRETPSFGVYFLTYDVLTRTLGCEPGDRLLVPKLLLAGGTSGIMSWLSTYPVDVVKSRLQADGLRGTPRYCGILDCVRQSYQAEGWRVFTRGLASTLLRAFPVNAATFATVTVVLTYARGEETRLDGEAVPGAAPAAPALAQPSSL